MIPIAVNMTETINVRMMIPTFSKIKGNIHCCWWDLKVEMFVFSEIDDFLQYKNVQIRKYISTLAHTFPLSGRTVYREKLCCSILLHYKSEKAARYTFMPIFLPKTSVETEIE